MKYSLRLRWGVIMGLLGCFVALSAHGQLDPTRRDLLQFGYNQAFEGHAPLAAYAFYYRNQPGFLQTNLTLRLAIAPTYLDSELGIAHALGPNTDLGVGLAGGGFADSYEEVRQGIFLPKESFTGHGGSAGLSVYHLFNPGQTIPLYGVLRGSGHYTTYERDDQTARDFALPPDHTTFAGRAGLRWGGREPMLFPDLAMELSVWYEGQLRTSDDLYGYGDRRIESSSHLFWGEAFLAYTMPEWKHSLFVHLTAGTSIDADRFDAYRLGALLPLISEFPLSLPGYYYQELSAQQFVLLGGSYFVPLDAERRWNVNLTAATAFVDYLPGLEQPGNWHSGVGGGILYKAPSWKVMLTYGYGVDAMRTHGRGAHSVGILMQVDLGQAKMQPFKGIDPSFFRSFQRFFGLFGG